MQNLPIRLNFFALSNQEFCFTLYRQKFNGQPKQDGFYKAKLPTDNSLETYEDYYVTTVPKDGFERFVCLGDFNTHLTVKLLWDSFLTKIRKSLNQDEYEVDDRRFSRKLAVVIGRHPEGNEVVEMEPYYLKSERKFGFLVDFAFHRAIGVPYSLRVQQLSLSVKHNYRANFDFYNDKYGKIETFKRKFKSRLFPFSIEEQDYDIENELYLLPSQLLKTKTYIFENGESNSQFQGLKTKGPFAKVEGDPLFVFVFEPHQRDQANDLYSALVGKAYPGTFPGIQSMFNLTINKDNVLRILIPSLSRDDLSKVEFELERIINSNKDKKIASFFIINEQEKESDSEFSPYHYLKFIFTRKGIPLQTVRFEKITGRDGLKWSVANIGLGLFAKMGGIPWKVKPSNEKCIIFGLGSAHKIGEDGRVKKYFAYSVSMDSSGVYKQINVLGDAENKTQYIEQLKENIKNVIDENIPLEVEKCVIHLPFKIKKEEMESIQTGVREVSESHRDIQFQFIKINTVNKFFGYAENNSKVPYESSYVQLAPNEYLVWFEGLHYGKELVNKRFGSPVHIEFLNSKDLPNEEKRKYLQDIINLSGANWRGFNAKLSPISIFYPDLIAKFIAEFQELDSDNSIDITGFEAPWFL
ncbi:Piwi domain-containing protein [Effusibacillus consociatus]|uniref:Protein argonaute n=1 Tax=Effusibacillus consociatus TaxID=1117041 RepID=A0ABV9PZ13_9BACL